MSDEPEKHDEPAESTSDPLRLVLHTMEEQLDDRVGAVSNTGPAREESTSDLIRLEETLSSAQDKAKQLVTLRLKLDGEAPDTDATGDLPTLGSEAAAERAAATDADRDPEMHADRPSDPSPRPSARDRPGPPPDTAPRP